MTKNDESQSPTPSRARLWIAAGLGLLALALVATWYVRWARVTSRDACHDEADPEACLEDLAGRLADPHLCAGLKRRDHCLFEVALNSKSGQACEQIQDAAVRSKCAEGAVEFGGDPALCQLAEPANRGHCFALAAKQRGPEVCARAPEDDRGPCLTAVANEVEDLGAACGSSVACRQELGTIDIALCDDIPAANAQALAICLRSLDRRIGRVPGARCRELTQPAARDACFTRLARVRAQGYTCALVEDAARRERCIDLAGARDPALCRALTAPESRLRCLQRSSYDSPNRGICQELQGSERAACLERTAERLALELARVQ
ncbi:MAG TPA: hypothetical protein VJV79_01260 [Polyangiaceae bacterium]|nr:hypothetical protein [Polyangiaceae bacterium]